MEIARGGNLRVEVCGVGGEGGGEEWVGGRGGKRGMGEGGGGRGSVVMGFLTRGL